MGKRRERAILFALSILRAHFLAPSRHHPLRTARLPSFSSVFPPTRRRNGAPFRRYLKNRASIRADVVIVHQGRCALSWPRFSNGVSPVTLNRDHVPAPICFPTLGITLAAFRFVRPRISTPSLNGIVMRDSMPRYRISAPFFRKKKIERSSLRGTK